MRAVTSAAAGSDDVVDVIGNYTAFYDLLGAPACERRAAAHRGRLPRPPGHLRRRRERPGAGPAGRVAWPRRRAAPGRLRPPPPGGRPLLPGWGRGRSAGPRRPDAHRRRHAGAARGGRRGGPGGVRGIPDRRADLSRRRRRAARGRGSPRRRDGEADGAARGGRGAGRGRPRLARTAPDADWLREPRRGDVAVGRDRRAGAASSSAWATASATAAREPCRAASSGRTSTVPCWRGTRRWPTGCSPGRSATSCSLPWTTRRRRACARSASPLSVASAAGAGAQTSQ